MGFMAYMECLVYSIGWLFFLNTEVSPLPCLKTVHLALLQKLAL